MKTNISRVLTIILALAFVLTAFAGCRELVDPPPPDEDMYFEIDNIGDTSGWTLRERPNLSGNLSISFVNLGFGRSWMDEMVSRFEEAYPNVNISLQAITSLPDATLRGQLEGNNPADIYIFHRMPWESLSRQGLIANLNDLYASAVYYDANNYGNPVTFEDRISRASLRSSRVFDFATRERNYFKVPFVTGVGGLAFNYTMFYENGWDVPETVEELFELAETIVAAQVPAPGGGTVRPFVWSESQYLWDSVVFDWWAQLAGITMDTSPTSIMNFNRLLGPEQFDPELWPELKTAFSAWHDLIAVPGSRFSMPMSTGQRDLDAQMAFVQGHAAMIPAASWLVTELRGNEEHGDLLEQYNIDVRMMPTPIIEGARTDEYGDPIRVNALLEYNQSIIVAQNANNKANAFEFLRFMTERDNSMIFPEHVNGALFAHRYDFDALIENAETGWERSMYEIMSTSMRFSTWSDNPIYTLTPAGPWPDNHGYALAFNSPTAVTPESFFRQRHERAVSQWPFWLRQSGLR